MWNAPKETVRLDAAQNTTYTVAPACEYLAASHSVQATDPLVALYLPAAHARQAPPSGPVYPALHLQSVMSPLPTADEVL